MEGKACIKKRTRPAKVSAGKSKKFKKEESKSEDRDVQVLEEGDAVPLQDVSTEGFLKEMGLDWTPMFDPPLDTFQNMYVEQYLCPVHLEEMSQRSYEGATWTYWCCPVADCFVMTGVHDEKEYFSAVHSQLAAHYKEKWNEVRCFCDKPVVLCKSRSKKNPTSDVKESSIRGVVSSSGQTNHLALTKWMVSIHPVTGMGIRDEDTIMYQTTQHDHTYL